MTPQWAWPEDQWETFCNLIAEGWPGTFDGKAARSWRLLLNDVQPADAVAAMRRLLFAGQTFRPSASELLGEMRRDRSAPTFEEAYRLIFGQGGILSARPSRTEGPWVYANETQRRALLDAAAVSRAADLHPLVGAFVGRLGLTRLRALGVDCPDYGELRRKGLREEWDRHVAASDGREVAALAAGDRSGEGLRQLDPLTALGIARPVGIGSGGAS